MEEQTRFHKDDQYIVSKREPHRPLMIDVLVRLYQPLMSTTALSLYLLLWSEAERDDTKFTALHRDIMAMLNVEAKHLERAFYYLEGIGLLRTYKKENQAQAVYLYQLQTPLSARSFFADEVLTFLLVDTLGDVRVQQLKEAFGLQASLSDDVTEVTAPFQKMYAFSEYHYAMQPSLTEVPADDKGVRYSKEEWQWFQHFLRFVDEQWVDPTSLKDHKDLIMTAHTLYQFDDELLNEMITASVHPQTGILDAGKFQSLMLRSGRAQKAIATTMKEEEVEERPKSHKEQLFHAARLMAPVKFLESIKGQRNGIVTSDEMFTLKNIVEARVFDSSALNLVTYYCLWVKKEPELKRNRYEKIVNRLAQQKLQSLDEIWKALPTVYNEVTQFKQANNYTPKKTVVRPEWEEQSADKVTLSKEEVEKNEAMMKEQLQKQLAALRGQGGDTHEKT